MTTVKTNRFSLSTNNQKKRHERKGKKTDKRAIFDIFLLFLNVHGELSVLCPFRRVKWMEYNNFVNNFLGIFFVCGNNIVKIQVDRCRIYYYNSTNLPCFIFCGVLFSTFRIFFLLRLLQPSKTPLSSDKIFLLIVVAYLKTNVSSSERSNKKNSSCETWYSRWLCFILLDLLFFITD